MPRDNDIEEAGPDLRAPHAAQGAPRSLGTVPSDALLTLPEAPADLSAALATTPAEWGRCMFDPASLDTRMAACKLTVKHPKDLLVLRQALFDDLCPSITWILRTSVLEWEYLSTKQKQQQPEMREAWLSGNSKPSEAILQHWLWKFLKDSTRQFALLPTQILCEASWSAWLTKNSQAQILYTPSTIKSLLLNARTFGVLTACPSRLRPSPP
jgi:hypothetical protein